MTEINSEPRQAEIASLGIRALAALLDILIIVVIWSAFGLAFGEAPDSGAGFKFVNPNADRTCGCGSSFSV